MFNNDFFVQKMNEQNLNTYQMADKIGVSQAMVSSIACGYKSPSFDLAVRISRVFNCSLDELVRGEKK